jgi:hypothetical protein
LSECLKRWLILPCTVSLIETAKANGIEPYAYLRLIFTELPQASSLEDIEALLPINSNNEENAAA